MSLSFSLWLFDLSFRIFVGALVFHLLEADLSYLEVQALKQLTEDLLVVSDGLCIKFIKIHPDLNTIAEAVGIFRGDESEPIYLFTLLKGLPNELKSEVLIDFFPIWLTFRHLKDEPSSFLVLLIFPFRLNTLPEKLN